MNQIKWGRTDVTQLRNKLTKFSAIGFGLCVVAAIMSVAVATAQDRSQLTGEANIFAVAHLDKIQTRSFSDGAEYCGLIGYDAQGALKATQAKKGRADSCRPDEDPDALDVIATYHTHGAFTFDADTEVPSIDDLKGDIEEETNGYIATPGGRVWFNDSAGEETRLLCGRGCVVSDPNFKECQGFLPSNKYTVQDLEVREDEDTGAC
jgi:hypothetical protein